MLRSGVFSKQESDVIDKNLKIARKREASDGVRAVIAGSRPRN
jgi:hypothetical protein